MIVYKEHILTVPQSLLEKNGVPFYLNETLGKEFWIVINVKLISPEGIGGPFTIVALAWRHEQENLEALIDNWIQLSEPDKKAFLDYINRNEVQA